MGRNLLRMLRHTSHTRRDWRWESKAPTPRCAVLFVGQPWVLTFDMSGSRKQAQPAGGRPLDGGVRPNTVQIAFSRPQSDLIETSMRRSDGENAQDAAGEG